MEPGEWDGISAVDEEARHGMWVRSCGLVTPGCHACCSSKISHLRSLVMAPLSLPLAHLGLLSFPLPRLPVPQPTAIRPGSL